MQGRKREKFVTAAGSGSEVIGRAPIHSSGFWIKEKALDKTDMNPTPAT